MQDQRRVNHQLGQTFSDQLPISLYTRQKRKESHFILQECTYLFDKYSKYSYVFFRVE